MTASSVIIGIHLIIIGVMSDMTTGMIIVTSVMHGAKTTGTIAMIAATTGATIAEIVATTEGMTGATGEMIAGMTGARGAATKAAEPHLP